MLLLDSRRGRASPTEASISALSLVGANIAERGTSLKCWRDLSEAANRVGATTEASRSDRRSAIPSQLCIERSTGDTIRRKGLILAGYRRAQRALVEAAWTYHYPARASETLRARLEGLRRACATSPERRRFACAPGIAASAPRARKLPVVVAAIAREMAAYLWAIGSGGRAGVRQRRKSLQSRCAGPGAPPARSSSMPPSRSSWPVCVRSARAGSRSGAGVFRPSRRKLQKAAPNALISLARRRTAPAQGRLQGTAASSRNTPKITRCTAPWRMVARPVASVSELTASVRRRSAMPS